MRVVYEETNDALRKRHYTSKDWIPMHRTFVFDEGMRQYLLFLSPVEYTSGRQGCLEQTHTQQQVEYKSMMTDRMTVHEQNVWFL